MKRIPAWMLILLSVFSSVQGQSPAPVRETKAQFDARIAWWRNARFGMFIHWDMSSMAGTEISWSRGGSKPLDTTGDPAGYVEDPVYDHLYQKFDPEKFDAAKWVAIAKDAGMKYIVFTAKHHGGFSMFDTKMTDYSIMHTPFHRDVVKELADACHKAGMRFGIYYSPRDWHQPDYGIGDNRKYVDYMNGQVRELLSHYGKIDVIWWDSYGRGDLISFWRENETFDLVKKLQPNILMNNRLAVLAGYDQQPEPYRGDFDTPEQRLGAFQNNRPWESCITLSAAGTWSYRPNDSARSFEECIRSLASCATGDGNILLDVGPSPEGEIPAPQVERLAQIGEWMRKCGASIYGTRGGPYSNNLGWGGSTYRGNTIYLHIFKWPGDSLELLPLKAKVLKIGNLSDPTAIPTFQQNDGSLTVTLPADKQDKIDTVISLELSGPVENEMEHGFPLTHLPIHQTDNGTLVLPAEWAQISGGPAQMQNTGVLNIGYWTNTSSSAKWKATLAKPGSFVVKLTYACPADAVGSSYVLKVGDQSLQGTTIATPGWDKFNEVTVGNIQITSVGPTTITLQPTNIAKNAFMNLEKVELDPK
jgi:alpha-L-fucosidase